MKDQQFENDAEKVMKKGGFEGSPAQKDPARRSSVRSMELHNNIQEKLDQLYLQKKGWGHKVY